MQQLIPTKYWPNLLALCRVGEKTGPLFYGL